MLSEKELLAKVRKIEIKSRGLSNNIFAGKYHSAFRGRGMSFSEVREYRFGDDVRDIDWNVTARTRAPHIKIYEEERELTMMLLVDVSASNTFGTTEQVKREVIAEIAAVLAFSAVQTGDKVGCLMFSDKVEHYIPPKKGKGHILTIIRSLLSFESEGRGTRLDVPLKALTNMLHKRCTTFVLSDFLFDFHQAPDVEEALKIAVGKHDLVGIRISDERERELPDVGLIEMSDAETGRTVWVDTSSRRVRENYARLWNERNAATLQMLRRYKVDCADIDTADDYVTELIKLFKQR
ncbi:MAG: DUF58 domain-containing protein [Rikenellaceae bacterium]|jgi:uncharacterized protein (DUF58 family)|nr:DUF58 domain-containing protein [Rikenellaceae bacterium]